MRPLVFLPGYYGSKLRVRQTGEIVWIELDDVLNPERTMRVITLDGQNDLEVAGVLDEFLLFPFLAPDIYKSLFRFLRRLGYRAATMHAVGVDWRQSLIDLADHLHREIQQLGASRVDLLCHSHGGLIARAYMQRHGHQKVARLITMGTPHTGMLKVLQAVHEGIELAFFGRSMSKPAARSFPSAFELMPSRARDDMFRWQGIASTPFETTQWTAEEADPIARAKLQAFTADAKQVTTQLLPETIPVPAYFIYGTRLDTLIRAQGGPGPLQFVRDDDGDTTITRLSASGSGLIGNIQRCAFPFAKHMLIFNQSQIRKTLKSILLDDKLPHTNFHAAARLGHSNFHTPNQPFAAVAEVRTLTGETIAGLTATLTIKRGSQTILDTPLPQSDRGDYVRNISLPASSQPHRWTITFSGFALPEPISKMTGTFLMR